MAGICPWGPGSKAHGRCGAWARACAPGWVLSGSQCVHPPFSLLEAHPPPAGAPCVGTDSQAPDLALAAVKVPIAPLPSLSPPSRVCHTRLSARPWEAARLAPSERPALAGSPLTEQLPAGSRAALKDAPFTGGDAEAQVRASDLASGSTSVWRLPNRAGCCLWASVFRL